MSPHDSHFFHHGRRHLNKRADALANGALDAGSEFRWYRRGLRDFFLALAAPEEGEIFIQTRLDVAFKRKSGRITIGVSIEYVRANESRFF